MRSFSFINQSFHQFDPVYCYVMIDVSDNWIRYHHWTLLNYVVMSVLPPPHLQVSELEGPGALRNDLTGHLQSLTGLLLPLGGDDLGSRLPRSLSLGRHHSLELDRQSDVLTRREIRLRWGSSTDWGGRHYISTRSTLIPQGSVASSRDPWEDRISGSRIPRWPSDDII